METRDLRSSIEREGNFHTHPPKGPILYQLNLTALKGCYHKAGTRRLVDYSRRFCEHMPAEKSETEITHAELYYTQAAYTERTTLPCAPLTFREISASLLSPIVSNASSVGVSRERNVDSSIDRIDMVVCSFALHLVESSSEVSALLRELSTKALWLVVLAPRKKPEVRTTSCLVYARIQQISRRSKQGVVG
ncbi:hypothetical protein J3R82DRAFT_9845 [Butyriboletus roseoflavus]|nr:hypothetical protein J3R82DRAFT_9845 [Butyriboletus roseoflavus]